MDGIVGPAIGAGGRTLAVILRRNNWKRKASLKLSATTTDVGAETVFEVTLENPRGNLDSVEVSSITPRIRIHDQSCGDPEFVKFSRSPYAGFPKFPIALAPGESKTWSAKVLRRDVLQQYEQESHRAMKRTWGDQRFEEFLELERRAEAFRKRNTFMGKLARVLHAVDDTGPGILLQVNTKQDGEFTSSELHLTATNLVDRCRSAWKNTCSDAR
ncbi:hypothetical protein [Leucobacter triazinivorans]|uniref:Uncharacterized protein n=1 Tax=Leucobacter triazinivorans TaxID=1784719 RepID=A0A4P6KC76_9MICO|nr:hypothetical protein [Leucobacter triazinivorans]QBE47703.1 hypothetical protein EVS81_01715 [Leucobacter triazinivorans]